MAKIVIVGGGPAGSSMALFLLKQGIGPEDIVLLDKASFPRPKLCGGGITFRGTELLAELLPQEDGAPPPGAVETLGLEFVSSAGSFPAIEAGKQWVYDRAQLDNSLLQAVKDAGVVVREQTLVRDLSPTSTGWTLDLGDRSLEAEWVVGADGARGTVRRKTGLKGGPLGLLVEAYYRPTKTCEPKPKTLIFDFDPSLDGIPGYAWIFPYTQEGIYKIGVMDALGATSGKALRTWTDGFAAKHGFERIDDKIAGWPEHYFSPTTEAHRTRLILVGESWGIDPLLGEGIAPSFEMAKYAAKRLAAVVRNGADRIRGYETGFLKTEPGINLMFQYAIARVAYNGDPNRWMRIGFTHEGMRQLAGQGTEAYGRLAKRAPKLGLQLMWQFLREGIPSAEPIVRNQALEARGRISHG